MLNMDKNAPMATKKIVSVVSWKAGIPRLGFDITYTLTNGEHEIFSQSTAAFSDGSKCAVFTSNKRAGCFKHVFVPFDFEHKKIVHMK
jgi:hypothetical protein